MDKPYKISYKTYFNDKLKEVSFGTSTTHPLYVQLSFGRKTLFFKSYYFELFSKSKYLLYIAGKVASPSIEQIQELESQVIEFIINKHSANFSLDLFKMEYAYYSQDICELLEDDFRDFLHTFFEDKGMPAFAMVLFEGSRQRISYDIVRDLSTAFTKDFYNELQINALSYGPPYLPLYDFVHKMKNWPLVYLNIMDWESPQIKKEFEDYLKAQYSLTTAEEIISKISLYVEQRRELTQKV